MAADNAREGEKGCEASAAVVAESKASLRGGADPGTGAARALV
jgi:hypothetical protein